jgi:hypothetical protein
MASAPIERPSTRPQTGSTVGAPVPHDAIPPEEGLSDGALGRAMAFGFTGGAVGMTLVCILMSLAGNADLPTAVGIAILPGIVAGFFFGGTAWMSYEVSKSGH